MHRHGQRLLTGRGTPGTLAAAGKDGRKVEMQDVLVGEVWLSSGQSDMEMSVKAANHFDAKQAAANLPPIRYYSDTNGTAAKPQAEGKGFWQACSSATVGRFSATLYLFGREIFALPAESGEEASAGLCLNHA